MRLVAFVLALCLGAGTAAASPTLDQIAQRGTVRIGYISDQAPFSFKGKDGNPAGYAIGLCQTVAAEIGHQVPHVKVEYVESTLSDAFDAVAAGRVDLLCGAVTINLTRREKVDFSQPIFVTGASGLLRSDSPEDLQVLFLDKRPARAVEAAQSTRNIVGVRTGTTTDQVLRAALGGGASRTKIADFATHSEGLKALEDHKIDAYFADRALLISLASRARDPKDLSVGTRLFTHEPYGIAVKRGDPDFRLLVDRTLTTTFLSDDFLKLLKTYFGSEASTLRSEITMQSIPE